jgi:hypothetical protein
MVVITAAAALMHSVLIISTIFTMIVLPHFVVATMNNNGN